MGGGCTSYSIIEKIIDYAKEVKVNCRIIVGHLFYNVIKYL